MTRVISIGTTHPWNIAGLGLDIAIGREFGVEVFTVVAGVSAQNDRGVTALYAIPAAIVRHQLDVTTCHPELVEGRDALGGAAIRVGALVSAENVRAVAEFVRAHPHVPAVVDPVFAASNGGRLADEDAIVAIRDELAIAPSVILTPNLDEAAMLLGSGPIERDDLADAARTLRERGCRAVVLKGGHLVGEPIDALATADGVELLQGERIAGSMRGTGCALAMALACELARGRSLREALDSARVFVKGRLESACKANAPL
jgi:hydroxymethylpyrimidine/phosphomethylpyrimidine kinase